MQPVFMVQLVLVSKKFGYISYTYKAPVGNKGNLTFQNLGFYARSFINVPDLKRKTDQTNLRKQKRTDDEIAKVNQKADDAGKKADDADKKQIL